MGPPCFGIWLSDIGSTSKAFVTIHDLRSSVFLLFILTTCFLSSQAVIFIVSLCQISRVEFHYCCDQVTCKLFDYLPTLQHE
eukprot:m.104238 g.104238  ORF g.104238 m.104238 type:complete len:82 (-) comp13257_c1_seq2:31-276(-)